ncbi:TlpA family protein disulfide reductase [Myxococcota bacterium]|nr:TlpA family protein disulfide reductase [Myxococcota bacterium]MBU1379783.1 TlpA family protein disulfide reductase [Myxococcota bacterium]MBU1498505.1 TlpA family protein disulfide reductase [Myxococcota bacterium]
MKYICVDFLNSCFLLDRKISDVDNEKSSFTSCLLLFIALILLGAYAFNFVQMGEIVSKVGAGAIFPELWYIVKVFFIKDFMPLLIIFVSLLAVKKLSVRKRFEITMSAWMSAILIRTFLEAVPRLFPKLIYYPLPYMEIPQAVAYGQGLIALAIIMNHYFGRRKDPGEESPIKKPFSIGWSIIVAAALVGVVWYPAISSMPYFIKAPEFVLPSDDGAKCDLKAEKGKTVLIEFWRTTCPHCRKQAKELDKVVEKFGDKVTYLSIHTSGGLRAQGGAKAVMTNPKVKLCYDDGTVSRVYSKLPKYQRLRGVPHMLILDQHGVIRSVIRGYKTSDYIERQLSRFVSR